MTTIEFADLGGGDADFSDSIKPADINGHLIIAYPVEHFEAVRTKFTAEGEPGKPAIRLHVADLDDPAPGDEGRPGLHRDCLWFNAWIVNDLKRTLHKPVLARVGQGSDSSKGNPPWVLIDAKHDHDAVTRATAWLNANPGSLSGESLSTSPAPQPAPQPAPTPAPSAASLV